MQESNIEWTDKTWNPVRGCRRVSPGCERCYAERTAARFVKSHYEGLVRLTPKGPRWTGEVRTLPEKLDEPLRWRKPQRVFVNSMSDLFHEDVSPHFIARVFARMAVAPQHTYQVLTKRADVMRTVLGDPLFPDLVRQCVEDVLGSTLIGIAWPLPNVWIGVSVEDQQRADERIPLLLETPAAVRFLSCEPLLGPVSLRWLSAWPGSPRGAALHPTAERTNHLDGLRRLDWVIVGGESGPGARPCALEWIESVVEQCRGAAVPVFVKQLGAVPVSEHRRTAERGDDAVALGASPDGWAWSAGLNDRKGGDPAEWPEALRVRQFPEVRS